MTYQRKTAVKKRFYEFFLLAVFIYWLSLFTYSTFRLKAGGGNRTPIISLEG
jgi:hypothetical protein